MALLASPTAPMVSSRIDVMTKEPMVSRTVLMPVDLYRRIADYADAHEISWSAAVRRLVEANFPHE